MDSLQIRRAHKSRIRPVRGDKVILIVGLIQSFEFTHELAWNVLKDYLEHKGIVGLIGSRDASRAAFKNGLIKNGEDWMKMIEARNLTSHTYDPKTAEGVAQDIIHRFFPAFEALIKKLSGEYSHPDMDS